MSISEKISTYPSLNPTLALSFYRATILGLREGFMLVHSYDIDPSILNINLKEM